MIANRVKSLLSVDLSYIITPGKTLVHDTGEYSHCAENSVCEIDGTHFLLAYQKDNSIGVLKSFSVNGSNQPVEISSYTFDNVSAVSISILKISSSLYAIAYSGDNYHGYIITVSVNGSYEISPVDSIEHSDTLGVFFNSLVKISPTLLVLSFQYTVSKANVLRTFSIDTNADNIAIVDTLSHDETTTMDSYISLALIDTTHCIVTYSHYNDGTSTYTGRIKTFSFDANADNITQLDEETFSVATYGITNTSIVSLSSSLCITANEQSADTGYTGYISTISLDGSYAISIIDTVEHQPYVDEYTTSAYNNLLKINATHCVLSYSSSYGVVKTFEINGSNEISVVDSKEFNSDYAAYISLTALSSILYVTAYQGLTTVYGTGTDGYVTTLLLS